MKTIARLTLLLVLALAIVAVPAMADITGQLTVANGNLASQGAGPYASYDISGSGTSYTVSVTGLNNFVFGATGTFALDLSTAAGAGSFTGVTGCTDINGAATSCGSWSQLSAGNEDGFGSFNFRIDGGNGFSNPFTSFTFTFDTANSVDLTTLLDTALPNAAGHLALKTNTACTGFAANGGTGDALSDTTNCTSPQPPPVPEPASLFLFGSGLSALGLFGRRKLRK